MATDQLSRTFAALADPTRRAILRRLSAGAATVTELAGPFDMSLPAVSKHLAVLERAGLISKSRDAQWRRARLRAAPLEEAASWIGDYSHFWQLSFDALESHLMGQLAGEPSDHQPPTTTPTTPPTTTTESTGIDHV